MQRDPHTESSYRRKANTWPRLTRNWPRVGSVSRGVAVELHVTHNCCCYCCFDCCCISTLGLKTGMEQALSPGSSADTGLCSASGI